MSVLVAVLYELLIGYITNVNMTSVLGASLLAAYLGPENLIIRLADGCQPHMHSLPLKHR
jgi:hypothetical protein